MGFLRHRRDPVWIALLALAMQLAAAFGHVHLDDAEEHEAEQAIALACEPGPQQPCPPAEHHDPHTCAICWTMGLVAASVQPTPPALPLLDLVPNAYTPSRAPLPSLIAIRFNFQARAPPPSASI